MQDDSIGAREELLANMREMAKQNENNLKYCTSRRPGYVPAEDRTEKSAEEEGIGGTFGLRLFLCLAIWGGFFWMHMENAPIMGYQTEKVVEAVSTDVGLQELTNSVTIEP